MKSRFLYLAPDGRKLPCRRVHVMAGHRGKLAVTLTTGEKVLCEPGSIQIHESPIKKPSAKLG